MTIGEIHALFMSGRVRVEAYHSDGNVTVCEEDADHCLPFDVTTKEVTGISVINDQLVLEYYDDSQEEV